LKLKNFLFATIILASNAFVLNAQPADVKSALKRGYALVAQENYEAAIEEYRKISDRNGDDLPDECQGSCCQCGPCDDLSEVECFLRGGIFGGYDLLCGEVGACYSPLFAHDLCSLAYKVPSAPIVSTPFDNRCAGWDEFRPRREQHDEFDHRLRLYPDPPGPGVSAAHPQRSLCPQRQSSPVLADQRPGGENRKSGV